MRVSFYLLVFIIWKEIDIMNRTIESCLLRIALLETRGKDNGNIIKKIKRKIRQMEK